MLLVVVLILCILFIIFSSTRIKLHPFLALLFATLAFGLFTGMPLPKIIKSINDGFGGTLGYIGIVIVAGTIIGTFLEFSGGAYALADRILRLIGGKRVPLAMAVIGYVLSIAVFADSAFVILSSLNKALSKRAKISLAGSAIALSLGLTVTHCLVPPTPGPIAAAGIVGADLGLVILFGMGIAGFALVNGWLFAEKYASRIWIDPSPDVSMKEITAKVKEAPSSLEALGPILAPLVLIVLRSVAEFPTRPFGEGSVKALLGFVGEPVIALLIGVLLAFGLPRKLRTDMLSDSGWVGTGLRNATIIILITGAGGAFGKVLQNSELADVIGRTLSNARIGILMPFLIAAMLKSAQGSSTVALITAASIMAPLMPSMGLTSEIARALVVMSIASGAMVVSHANDSFFWVVTQMSRMDVRRGYQLQSLGTLVTGVTAGLVTWVISLAVI